jgi:hypothetical protein
MVSEPEGKRLLGSAKCGWDDNIKMYLRQTVWEDVDHIHLGQRSGQ